MKKAIAYSLVAAMLVLLVSCPNPLSQVPFNDAVSLPPDLVNDVPRSLSGPFTFETLLPVTLNLQVDLYAMAARAKGPGSLQKLPADAAAVIVDLRDTRGNTVYEGKVKADGTLGAMLRLPAAPEDMILTLSADKFGERAISIKDMRRYIEVNRTVSLASNDIATKDIGSSDRDGDGVPDDKDDYLDDPNAAFTVHVPANGPLTIAFEDLYLHASAGDADYNDFIAKYNLTLILNADNKIVRLEGEATAAVRLAGYNHRFGIVVGPFEGDARLSVTYLNSGIAQKSAVPIGTKQLVSGRANIVLFVSTKDSIGKTTTFSLDFDTPQDQSSIDQPPYDPYLYVYNTGYDIHLIGESALPGSRNPSGSAFRDAEGFPWALLVPSDWKHPDETQRIEVPYPRFSLWRQSMGTEFTDWYLHYYDPYVAPTAATVSRVADINLGVGSSSPSGLTVFNSALYFVATDGTTGRELWKYDGSAASQVKDIYSGVGSGNPSYLTVYGLKLYFQATSNGTTLELYAYDGAAAPGPVTTLTKPQHLQLFGGNLLMGATDSVGTEGQELWSYNGSAIALVKDINVTAPNVNSVPSNLTVVSPTLLCFSANDGTTGRELWKSNGTTLGTTLVADINGSGDGLGFSGMAVFNSVLYFRGTDGSNGWQLWKYDGSAAPSAVTSFNAGAGGGVAASGMVVYGNALYFGATDGTDGWELWKWDGSSASRVADLNPGAGDGLASADMIVFDNALYFSGSDGASGLELWKWDGSTASQVKDINQGVGDSSPQQFQVFNGKLYFQADDGSRGVELWVLSQ